MSWDSQKDYLLFYMFRTLEKETSCLVLMVTMIGISDNSIIRSTMTIYGLNT